MPGLQQIASYLKTQEGRFDYLDAFVDDVDEMRTGAFADIAQLVEPGTDPVFAMRVGVAQLRAQLFPAQGIVRFCLASQAAKATDRLAGGAAIGGLIGSALTAASKAKENLLGGLILGMLVGGVVGAATEPLERVVAMQFERTTGQWRLYDGPLLRWAKRTLQPGHAA
jgi:hypothetical protein